MQKQQATEKSISILLRRYGQKNNRARIEFRPNFTTSGTYGLSIQAKDIASNNSGGDSEDSAYKIFFNVETAATVSDVLNYPNCLALLLNLYSN